MNLTVCLQPDMDLTTRAMGDPGTYEHFGYPRYFYVYVVGFTAAEGDYPESSGGTVCPLKDASDNDINRVDVGTDPSKWLHYLMTVDPPQTLLDSIYGCTQTVIFKLPSDAITKLRFYVAASPTPLKHDGHELGVKVDDDDQVLKAGNTESDVLNLMFDVDDDLKGHLQDLYSSPYNYRPLTSPYTGLYYYTITDPTKSEDITRIIYHVASKVDVKWNVAEEQQDNFCISYVQARKLKKKNCLLFRPTENAWTAADESDNDSKDLMDDDVARQWYGRQYFYTIPYRKDDNDNGQWDSGENTFDVNLHILKNGDDKNTYNTGGYNLLYHRSLPSPTYDVFVPWVRTDLRFTNNMTYGDVEKP